MSLSTKKNKYISMSQPKLSELVPKLTTICDGKISVGLSIPTTITYQTPECGCQTNNYDCFVELLKEHIITIGDQNHTGHVKSGSQIRINPDGTMTILNSVDGGLTFDGLLSTLIEGTNITIVDNGNQTLTINSTGGGSSSGLTFTDLANILQEGDNITLDIDNINQTITINSTGGSTIITDSTLTGNGTLANPLSVVGYIRRSDYTLIDHKSFLGIAPTGSLETDAVWTIWVTVTNTAGEVVSNTQYLNKKWSERNLL